MCCCNDDNHRGVRHGWSTGESVFEWADKGVWKCRANEERDFSGRKFRIGFEPLFVDFTKQGAVYMVFLLLKWFVLSLVAGERITVAWCKPSFG